MEKKDIAVISLAPLSAVALLLVFIFNGLSTSNGAPDLFNSSVGDISDKYSTDVTPAGYTFSIWGIIYFWQTAWTLYALSAIFRKNSKGRVILNPVVLTIPFYVLWIITCILNIVWLFTFDRESLLASFFVLFLFTLAGYALTALQAIATANNEDEIRKGSKVDLILIYVLVQNGVDMIFSWTTVATLLNLAIALTYSTDAPASMEQANASTLSLCILMVIVIGWSIAENTVFFRFFRFVYAWYGVLIWASVGILVKNYSPESRNSKLTIAVMVIAIVCLVVKIAVYIYKTKHEPKAETSAPKEEDKEKA